MAYLPDLQTTVGRYLDAWNAADPDERWHLVHAATAEEVVVLDPRAEGPVQGRTTLAAYLDHARRQGGRLEAAGDGDAVQGVFRLPVRYRPDGDGAPTTGLLVGTLDAEMRLVRVVHFLDA